MGRKRPRCNFCERAVAMKEHEENQGYCRVCTEGEFEKLFGHYNLNLKARQKIPKMDSTEIAEFLDHLAFVDQIMADARAEEEEKARRATLPVEPPRVVTSGPNLSGVEFQPADRPVEVSGPSGIEYFLDTMFEQHPEWSLVAVEAGAEQVASSYAEAFEPQLWVPNAAKTGLPYAKDEIYLVQLVNQPWTLLLFKPKILQRLSTVAEELARRLATQTVAFAHEETAGTSLLRIFDSQGGSEQIRGQNRWRKFFRDRGLFVPMFLGGGGEGRSCLVLEGVEPSQLERLDFFASN